MCHFVKSFKNAKILCIFEKFLQKILEPPFLFLSYQESWIIWYINTEIYEKMETLILHHEFFLSSEGITKYDYLKDTPPYFSGAKRRIFFLRKSLKKILDRWLKDNPPSFCTCTILRKEGVSLMIPSNRIITFYIILTLILHIF